MPCEQQQATPADVDARIQALTHHHRTLLVEAGAGSGKTALMAGRAALLVAGGVEPRHIAAITFTEAAAAELLERIERIVRDLLSGATLPELEPALPEGLSESQRANLKKGAGYARRVDLHHHPRLLPETDRAVPGGVGPGPGRNHPGSRGGGARLRGPCGRLALGTVRTGPPTGRPGTHAAR